MDVGHVEDSHLVWSPSAPVTGPASGEHHGLLSTVVTLEPVPSSTAGEVLTLQRAAGVSQAQTYGDVRLPPLTQSLDELRSELVDSRCLGEWTGRRLVGAVRTREDGELHVGRLVVAPDQQGLGIGSRLLVEVAAGTSCSRATLFTGSRSEGNLRLYHRRGYVEFGWDELRPGLEIVHLVKELR